MKQGLNADQLRFAESLVRYPRLAGIWDLENFEFRQGLYDREMGVMSHSECVMARFFLAVWQHHGDIDLPDTVSVLDREDREIIAAYILNPYWP